MIFSFKPLTIQLCSYTHMLLVVSIAFSSKQFCAAREFSTSLKMLKRWSNSSFSGSVWIFKNVIAHCFGSLKLLRCWNSSSKMKSGPVLGCINRCILVALSNLEFSKNSDEVMIDLERRINILKWGNRPNRMGCSIPDDLFRQSLMGLLIRRWMSLLRKCGYVYYICFFSRKHWSSKHDNNLFNFKFLEYPENGL